MINTIFLKDKVRSGMYMRDMSDVFNQVIQVAYHSGMTDTDEFIALSHSFLFWLAHDEKGLLNVVRRDDDAG